MPFFQCERSIHTEFQKHVRCQQTCGLQQREMAGGKSEVLFAASLQQDDVRISYYKL